MVAVGIRGRRRRQLEWSRGERSLRRFAVLGKNQTDEEVADETLDGDERLALPPETWQCLRSKDQAAALLDVSETDGLNGARRWLTASGLIWERVSRKRSPRRGADKSYTETTAG